MIRGVAVVDAPLPGGRSVLPNDPAHRLAVYTTRTTKARFASRIESGISQLVAAKYPVTIRDLGDEPRYLDADELAGLARWIDALDRF